MHVKIKICGLTTKEDVWIINQAKPDYAGFVFASGRHRLNRRQAAELKKALNPQISAVGVFADAPVSAVIRLVREHTIDLIQLHGEETPEYLIQLKKALDGIREESGRGALIKAIRMKEDVRQSRREISDMLLAYKKAGADYFLFDGEHGGSGKTFDWTVLPESPLPFFLAGGLHAGNLKEAVGTVKPYAVDLSSGAETEGRKDAKKICRIMEVLKKESDL